MHASAIDLHREHAREHQACEKAEALKRLEALIEMERACWEAQQ
jgi:hypothetical protein